MTARILKPELLVSAISTFSAVIEPERWVQPSIWGLMMRRQLAVDPCSSWDAALVQHCGYLSHYDHATDRSAWPIERALQAEEFGEWGRAHGLLREDAAPGDILLQYSPTFKRYDRAGVVVRVLGSGCWGRNRPYVDVLSVEGDVGTRGELHGGEVMRVKRRLWPRSKDKLVRWWEADSSARGQSQAEGA